MKDEPKKDYGYEFVRIVLDEELRRQLTTLARIQDRSMSAVVRELIRESYAKAIVEAAQ